MLKHFSILHKLANGIGIMTRISSENIKKKSINVET